MHTPGPWAVDRVADNQFNVDQNPPGAGQWSSVATVLAGIGSGCGSRIVGPDEAEANARLIAAAPDLLAACRDALVYLDHGEGSSPNGLRLISARELLQEVIAKATGNAH